MQPLRDHQHYPTGAGPLRDLEGPRRDWRLSYRAAVGRRLHSSGHCRVRRLVLTIWSQVIAAGSGFMISRAPSCPTRSFTPRPGPSSFFGQRSIFLRNGPGAIGCTAANPNVPTGRPENLHNELKQPCYHLFPNCGPGPALPTNSRSVRISGREQVRKIYSISSSARPYDRRATSRGNRLASVLDCDHLPIRYCFAAMRPGRALSAFPASATSFS